MDITDLKINDTGKIIKIVENHFTPKLLTLGFKDGVLIKLNNISPFRDALWVQINHQQIALRYGEARSILIHKQSANAL